MPTNRRLSKRLWLRRAPCGTGGMSPLLLHIPALTQKLVTIENIHVFIIPCANKLMPSKHSNIAPWWPIYMLALSSAKMKQVASNEETNMFVLAPI